MENGCIFMVQRFENPKLKGMNDMEKTEWFNENGQMLKPITKEQAQRGYHSGECYYDLKELKKELDFHIDTEAGRRYLEQIGIDGVEKMNVEDVDIHVLWDVCACLQDTEDLKAIDWQNIVIEVYPK